MLYSPDGNGRYRGRFLAFRRFSGPLRRGYSTSMKMLLYPAVPGDEFERVQAAAGDATVVNTDSEEAAAREVADADAFYGRISPSLFAAASKLRWVQAPIAGLEHYLFPELARSDVVVTNMRGIYNDHIADHAWAFVLAFARGFHVYLRRQARGEWNPGGVPVVHLADATLGIIGLGGIGEEVARRGATSGMRVLAVDPRRTEKPAGVDELWPAGRLDGLLAQSDFVVLCTPHTPETEKMIRLPQLRRMKTSAYLINIGRGIVVDLADLTQALQGGTIAGAGLDVYETEPLPPDHPLWSMENVLLTPHTAGHAPHTAERRLNVLLANVRRFTAGEPLVNVVDKRQWF